MKYNTEKIVMRFSGWACIAWGIVCAIGVAKGFTHHIASTFLMFLLAWACFDEVAQINKNEKMKKAQSSRLESHS